MSNASLSPPTESSLREAAIAHLARYAATRAGLARVLVRRIDNWARRARRGGEREEIAARVAAAKSLVEPIVARLATAGAVDDEQFAAVRSRSLTRAGRSGRAVAALLAAKGVPAEVAREVLPPDPAREFGACLVAAKKRRLGPFGASEGSDARNRERAALARAGFSERMVRDLFKLTREDAEHRLQEWRADQK